ncbi:MAG: hypothetical protein H0X54_10420 [Propionibacteriales bacterium]|nr:hypothetical protein [Propionibacteriales bacterium]
MTSFGTPTFMGCCSLPAGPGLIVEPRHGALVRDIDAGLRDDIGVGVGVHDVLRRVRGARTVRGGALPVTEGPAVGRGSRLHVHVVAQQLYGPGERLGLGVEDRVEVDERGIGGLDLDPERGQADAADFAQHEVGGDGGPGDVWIVC